MFTFYAYLRVSTEVQGDQYSLDSQSATAKRLHADKFANYTYTEIRDEESGRKARENLTRILQTIKEGDILFVYDNTRLARDEEMAYGIRVLAQKRKFRYFEGTREYDFSNKMDKLIFSILTIMSQFDSEMKSEKVKLNMRLQKERGEFISGPTFGYDYKDKAVTINPIEAEIVRRMFSLYLDRRSISKVADIIRAEGFIGKKGSTRFTATMVTQALKNPVYIGYQFKEDSTKAKRAGTIVDHSMLVKSKKYEPIVSEDLWWTVQDMYHKSAPRYRQPLAVRHSQFPYSSLFFCYRCMKSGRPVSYWRISQVGGNKKPAYGSNNHLRGCGTRPRNIREDRFVWIMETVIRLAFKRRDVIEKFIDDLENMPGTETAKDLNRKEELGKIRQQIDNQIQKLTLTSDFGIVRALDESINSLRARENELVTSLEKQTAEIERRRFDKAMSIARYRHENLDRIFKASPESRRAYIKETIKKAYVFNDQLVIQYEFGLSHVITIPHNIGPKLPDTYPLTEFAPRNKDIQKNNFLLHWANRTVYSSSLEAEQDYIAIIEDGNVPKKEPIAHSLGLYFPLPHEHPR